MSEKAKRLTLELRGKFNEIADKEVLAGRLEQGQVDGLLNEYLTHVVTSDGKKFFKDFTLSTNELGETIVKERPKSPTHPSVTQDLGFGEEFNNFAMERRIKKLKMPDGTWVERPTIEQINEVMRPYIKGGGNAFSENIADIYLARALKHNNLMFDETYMQEMMRMFGDDLPEGVFSPKKGFKTVMNYGLFKRNVEDIAKLKNSLAMEREIMVHRLEAFKRGEKFDAAAYMKQRGSDDYEKFVQEGYDVLGFNRDSYRTEGTPMLELTPEQVQKVQVWHQGTLDELKGKYKRWFDDAELNRRNGFEVGNKTIEQLMKYNDTLESLTPLEIKQMHGTITDKMNQARKISIAKNQNRVLGMYDKFTHLMKVSQTAMLPSFHVRNMLSNQFQNYLAIGNDVFDTGMQKKVMHVLRSQGDSKKLGAMQPLVVKNAKGETTGVMSWNDIILEAQARGVLDEGFFGAEIGARDKSAGLIKKLQGVKVGKKEVNLDPTSTENTLAKLGTNVGSNVEGHARLMQFVSHIKNGKSAEEAADLVNKYLFDYSDLTHFEQNVMKRIFPYYTWLRKNAKLQLTQMVEQPGKYRDTAKAMNAVESGVDEEDRVETQYLAPFAKDWLQISGFDKDGKTNILNPNMPFQDISRLPNPLDLKQSMEALIPQTNVLPKEILQQATNHDFFFNDKIQKEGEGAGKRLAHALTNYAPGLQIHDLLTKDDKGRQALSTAGVKTLNYDYATAKDVTIAKYLGKYKDKEPATVTKKFMDSLERKDAITVTQQSASRLLDDYINGEDIGKTKAGIFTPFAKVMKEVGLDKAKNREWVSATLDATHLEKYLTGSDFEMAKITKVRDGDTIEVELNGKKEAVRFNLIDTPEIAHQKGEKSMAFGDEAHRNMSRLAGLGKDARLVISKDKDAHGRLVAYVYVDGVDLNKEQLESGNAQLRYVNASENPYNYDEYRKAQTRAFDKRRGVWSIDGYADNKKGTDYNKREAYKRYQK
jgi:endonuclease YncB( thermonuclease family)